MLGVKGQSRVLLLGNEVSHCLTANKTNVKKCSQKEAYF